MKMMEKTLGSVVNNPKYYLRLSFEGVLIGLFAGIIVSFYRYLLTNSENILFSTLEFIKGDYVMIIAWLVLLAIMGLIVGLLMRWEPMSKGSGVPQVMGEIKGYLNSSWIKVLISKLIGGTLSTLAGLSLGREGPSVQLGAMAAKGASKYLDISKTDEKRFLICGSGAGLAATFNTPLSGVLFTLEEIGKGFDKTIVFVGLIAAIVADVVAKYLFGQSTMFPFTFPNIPLNYYWLLIVLGVVIGILGFIYNEGMIKASQLWGKFENIPIEIRYVFLFVVTGIVGLFIPQILAGGHSMMALLDLAIPPLSVLVVLLIGKYLLLIFCFGSGAPGGIFYPVLVIGAYIGAIFSGIVIPFFGLDPLVAYKFIVIAMAAMFASSIRTPITAIVLISEMTGDTNSLVAIIIVTVIAYVIPSILGNKPIYESLLKNLLNKEKAIEFDETKSVLEEYIIPLDCELIGKRVWDLPVPNSAIVVSVVRSGDTLVPDNKLRLKHADELFILMNAHTYAEDNDYIEDLIYKNRIKE